MPDLFDDASLAAKFAEYDARNPAIWELFQHFTFAIMNAGQTHYSADAILHRVRWETTVTSTETFKINNNYSAFYARKFMMSYPQYDGFFRTRTSQADNPSARHIEGQYALPLVN
jgi:hypothetical protein